MTEDDLKIILEKNCPSMNNLYLDKQGREFRDRIVTAMKQACNAMVDKCAETADTMVIDNPEYHNADDLNAFKDVIDKQTILQNKFIL